jgi:hypothetical protein
LDPLYTVTIFFGDRKQQRVVTPQINHLYTTAGTFTYSILVKPSERSAAPQLPTVKLSVTPTSVKPDNPVKFKADLSHDYPGIRYRFVFGDGSDSGWRDTPLTTYNYRSPGTYPAYVDIGLGNGGSVKRIDGSLRQPIEVRSPEPRRIAVQLTADRLTVKAKDEVTFLAQVNPIEPNLGYRFSFGDGSRLTEWQASPRTKHPYASAGTYPASVEVRVTNARSSQPNARSRPLSIIVEPPSPPSPAVDLFVAPRSVVAGFPVYFKATAASANSQVRYRFNFGDSSAPGTWQEAREETHIYSLAGTYPAFVEISRSSNEPNAVASSARKQVRVTPVIIEPPATPTPTPQPNASPSPTGTASPSNSPNQSPTVSPTTTPTPDGSPSPLRGETSPTPGATPSPSATASPTAPTSGLPDDWWKYVLPAALILFGGYQGWKYFFVPTPTLEPHVDPGVAALGTEGGPLAINFQMELDPNVTDGQFAVDTTEGSLIKSERKSNG